MSFETLPVPDGQKLLESNLRKYDSTKLNHSEASRASLANLIKSASTGKACIKSVQALPAQTNRLCQPVNKINIAKPLIQVLSLSNNALPVEIKARIELMYLHGLRVSEALRIKPSDVIPTGLINVKGSKGSGSRMVNGVLYNDYWVRYSSFGFPLPDYYSRFFVYRVLKQAGVYYKSDNNLKASITHS